MKRSIAILITTVFVAGCATTTVREKYAKTERYYQLSGEIYANRARAQFAVPGKLTEDGNAVEQGKSYALYTIKDKWLDDGKLVIGEIPDEFKDVVVVDFADNLMGISPEDRDTKIRMAFSDGHSEMGFKFIRQIDGLYYVNFIKPGPVEFAQINKIVDPPEERMRYVKWYRYPDTSIVYVLAGAWDIVTFPLLVLSIPFWPAMNR